MKLHNVPVALAARGAPNCADTDVEPYGVATVTLAMRYAK